jgi:hypothetical protein
MRIGCSSCASCMIRSNASKSASRRNISEAGDLNLRRRPFFPDGMDQTQFSDHPGGPCRVAQRAAALLAGRGG